MGLQEQIKKDLTAAMKAKDEEKKNILRVIMCEFSRQAQKEISDADVVKIVKKLVKSEKEVLEKSGGGTSRFIEVAESYLPDMASEEDIRSWIAANIDFKSAYPIWKFPVLQTMLNFFLKISKQYVSRIFSLLPVNSCMPADLIQKYHF